MNSFLSFILTVEILALVFWVMPRFLKRHFGINIVLESFNPIKNIRQIRYDSKHDMSDAEDYFKPIINWKLLQKIQEYSTKFEDEGKIVDVFVAIKYRKKEYWELYNYIDNRYVQIHHNDAVRKYKEGGLYYCICVSSKRLESAIWGEKLRNPDTQMFHDDEMDVFNRLCKKHKLKRVTEGDFHRSTIGEDSNIHGCYFKEIKKWYE